MPKLTPDAPGYDAFGTDALDARFDRYTPLDEWDDGQKQAVYEVRRQLRAFAGEYVRLTTDADHAWNASTAQGLDVLDQAFVYAVASIGTGCHPPYDPNARTTTDEFDDEFTGGTLDESVTPIDAPGTQAVDDTKDGEQS